MAQYRVVFYQDPKGREPMRDWLDELQRRRSNLAGVAMKLLKDLQELGPRVSKAKSFRYKGVLIYELRKRTPEGAMRIYYLRFRNVFMAVAGEIKTEDEADTRLLELVVRAYQEEVN